MSHKYSNNFAGVLEGFIPSIYFSNHLFLYYRVFLTQKVFFTYHLKKKAIKMVFFSEISTPSKTVESC